MDGLSWPLNRVFSTPILLPPLPFLTPAIFLARFLVIAIPSHHTAGSETYKETTEALPQNPSTRTLLATTVAEQQLADCGSWQLIGAALLTTIGICFMATVLSSFFSAVSQSFLSLHKVSCAKSRGLRGEAAERDAEIVPVRLQPFSPLPPTLLFFPLLLLVSQFKLEARAVELPPCCIRSFFIAIPSPNILAMLHVFRLLFAVLDGPPSSELVSLLLPSLLLRSPRCRRSLFSFRPPSKKFRANQRSKSSLFAVAHRIIFGWMLFYLCGDDMDAHCRCCPSKWMHVHRHLGSCRFHFSSCDWFLRDLLLLPFQVFFF